MTSSEFFSQYSTVMKIFTLSGPHLFDQQNDNTFPCSTTRIRKFAFVLKSIVVIIGTISHFAYVFTSIRNNVKIIDLSLDISLNCATAEGIILYILFCNNRVTIRSCILKLCEQWRDDVDLKPQLVVVKKEHLKAVSSFTHKISIALIFFAVIYLPLPFLLEIFAKFIMLSEGVTYPNRFHFFLPFELDKNYVIYIIFYIYDSFLGFNLAFLIFMGLLIITITMNNLRLLFILLQDDFKTLFDSGDEFNEEEMKKLITRHIRLLDLVKEVSKSFGNIFAVHLTFVSSTIAFFGTSILLHGLYENLQNFCVSIITMFMLFYCCLYSQLLSDSCLGVGNKICESSWYNLEPKHRKNILMILNRSQRITFIKSVSLMEISLDVFKKVIQISWSLISFTFTLYQK